MTTENRLLKDIIARADRALMEYELDAHLRKVLHDLIAIAEAESRDLQKFVAKISELTVKITEYEKELAILRKQPQAAIDQTLKDAVSRGLVNVRDYEMMVNLSACCADLASICGNLTKSARRSRA